ncbi:hypothetical protein BACCIP111899_01310 [Bacillus rhizoplanae]|uniref:Uncharacterized protein n=1 Tax=Bacillus rhizoplanae TaxID=2880966 RepID=A0ABM8Y8U0_9BACI|nr:hypothetical protein [Bacillus rhizoplanae]CAG9612138.1 hypothetical protein BACCIP111899_01310 [Bacillus rhizoplanae]
MLNEISIAAKMGKWITVAFVKNILKRLGRAIPGVGTLISLVVWGNAIHEARNAYRSI